MPHVPKVFDTFDLPQQVCNYAGRFTQLLCNVYREELGPGGHIADYWHDSLEDALFALSKQRSAPW
jgi:hypothetical protein